MKRKKFMSLMICLLLAIIFCIYLFKFSQENILQFLYDRSHNNLSLSKPSEISNFLKEFPILEYNNLDKDYLEETRSGEKKYKIILSSCNYRIIKRDDFFKKIVGNFRIKDFVCQDGAYRECLSKHNKEFYWLIDEKLLQAVNNLQTSLKNKGYDHEAFYIKSGHRHPKRNVEVKGASSSRHIKGQAVDIYIKDINKDGKYTSEDKKIILQILEDEVIGNKGGIGRYVHMDVRGKRARWDSY